ncbi:hypothetical protein P280DRAFT_517422 [Massarina eburnea CBS 473.64]|uniref:Uncharacterized protein n=1 Tax=Massarina eburnea CBS 473.64 TaxID=1395130 RepID=A0A6A6S252_9PLEO|nr:hypothetical protein P280DRAFT_517422 [Massarina eburnea CBS 473.64]
MPMAERELYASGRTSRASDMSTASRGPSRASGAMMSSDVLLTGVSSMLRTSTEMGGVGGLVNDSYRMSSVQRAPARRAGATSRLSATSSHSAQSSRIPGHRHLPSSVSTSTRRSRENNVPQYVADTLSPTIMHFPGSSPLIPRARPSRDGIRSQSLTTPETLEPTHPLSQQRSMASMRSLPRPGSRGYSNGYPAPSVGRMSGSRAVSPAFSDNTGIRPRSRNGYGNGYGGPVLPRHNPSVRRRIPSDSSLHRGDRDYPIGGPHVRTREPTFYGDIGPGIPPVPPLKPHHRANFDSSGRSHRSLKSQRSYTHRSGQGSHSSGSSNQRNDSDPPSSDGTFPPTPLNSVSMDRLTGLNGTQLMNRVMPLKKEPTYYDGSEQFHDEPEVMPSKYAPTGYTRDIRTIVEEKATPDRSLGENVSGTGHATVGAPDIPELPASPVGRRVTRDFVQSALNPTTTQDLESSGGLVETKNTVQMIGNEPDESATSDTVKKGNVISTPYIDEVNEKRYSVSSGADTSILNSSTLADAVHSFIPVIAERGITMDTDNHNAQTTGESDAKRTTEDGMSELMAAYEHTNTKPEDEEFVGEDGHVDERAERRSNHVAKPSDEESFKSCTDRPEPTENLADDANNNTISSAEDLPAPDILFKDSDAKSFKTAKDAITPNHAVSLSASRLPSSNVVSSNASEPKSRKPGPVASMSSPLASNQTQLMSSISESNVTRADTRLRANSRFNTMLGSAATSKSSLAGENDIHRPPVVPPRKSSNGKEAQRSSTLLNNLYAVWSKTCSGTGRKAVKKEVSEAGDQHDVGQHIPTPPPVRERPLSENASVATSELVELPKIPKSVPKKQDGLAQPAELNIMPINIASSNGPGKAVTPRAHSPSNVHEHAFDTPSPMIQQPSSIYSPNDSSSRTRMQPPSAMSPQTPVYGRRDSQTTTHLDHPARHKENPSNPPASTHRREEYDGDTTTDLKPARYYSERGLVSSMRPRTGLEDVKEESHEDSSLNTSASNLKHLPYRVGFTGLQNVRSSRPSMDLEDSAWGRDLAQSRADNGLIPEFRFSKHDLLSDTEFKVACNRVSVSFGSEQEGRGQLDRGCGGSGEMLDGHDLSAKRRGDKYRSVFGILDTSDASQRENTCQLFRRRPLSPKLVEEIEKVDIPSVDRITDMFTEMLPTLNAKSFDGCDVAAAEESMKHAVEEIHEVGAGPANKKSNARLRALPGSPGLVLVDDDVYATLTGTELTSSISPSGGCEGVSKRELVEIEATKGRSCHTRTSGPVPLRKTKTLHTSTFLPARSISLYHHNARSSFETRTSSPSCGTPSNTPTATETRPWNFSRYYDGCWDRDFEVNIELPSTTRSSPRPGPSNLHLSTSNSSSTGTLTPEGTTPVTHTSPAGALYVPQDPRHARRRSSQQPSNHNHTSEPGFDTSGFALAPVHVRDADQSHGAGERYPTSALTLPSSSHFPAVDSTFSLTISDDETEHRSSKKAIFGIKKRRSAKTPAALLNKARLEELNQPGNPESSATKHTNGPSQRHNRNTFTGVSGMSFVKYWQEAVVDRVQRLRDRVINRLGRLRRRHPATQVQHLPADMAPQNTIRLVAPSPAATPLRPASNCSSFSANYVVYPLEEGEEP